VIIFVPVDFLFVLGLVPKQIIIVIFEKENNLSFSVKQICFVTIFLIGLVKQFARWL
jgi:hypothetical protein